MVPEMSHHLASTPPISICSFRQDRDYCICQIRVWDGSDSYLCPMHTSNGKEAEGLATVCTSIGAASGGLTAGIHTFR